MYSGRFPGGAGTPCRLYIVTYKLTEVCFMEAGRCNMQSNYVPYMEAFSLGKH